MLAPLSSEGVSKPLHSLDNLSYCPGYESRAFPLVVFDAADYLVVTPPGHRDAFYFHLEIKDVRNYSKRRNPP